MTMEHTILEEDKANNNNNNNNSISKTKKRSFDVAFLMMPDDKYKYSQGHEKSAFKKIQNCTTTCSIANETSMVTTSKLVTNAYQHAPHLTPQIQQPAILSQPVVQSNYYSSMFLKPNNDFLRPDYLRHTKIINNDALFLNNPLLQSLVLPPSLAALTLPTPQNICAKCNINFRMTSDLVYHMRSHHKNDSANFSSDPCSSSSSVKRRREEKLKCPVCSELFRERHHLTRHMTAHQDKEGDEMITDKRGHVQIANYTNFYQEK